MSPERLPMKPRHACPRLKHHSLPAVEAAQCPDLPRREFVPEAGPQRKWTFPVPLFFLRPEESPRPELCLMPQVPVERCWSEEQAQTAQVLQRFLTPHFPRCPVSTCLAGLRGRKGKQGCCQL